MRMSYSLLESRVLLQSLSSEQLKKLQNYCCKRKRPPKRGYSSRPEKFRTQIAEWMAISRNSKGARREWFVHYSLLVRLLIGDLATAEQYREMTALRDEKSAESRVRRTELLGALLKAISDSDAPCSVKLPQAVAAAGFIGDLEIPQVRHAQAILTGLSRETEDDGKGGQTRILPKDEEGCALVLREICNPEPNPDDDDAIDDIEQGADEGDDTDSSPVQEQPASEEGEEAAPDGEPEESTPDGEVDFGVGPGEKFPSDRSGALKDLCLKIALCVPQAKVAKHLAGVEAACSRRIRMMREEEAPARTLPEGTVYTGVLRIEGYFYNFYPLFVWEDGAPRAIHDARKRFPDYGNVVLDNWRSVNPARTDSLRNGCLYNVQFEGRDLEPVSPKPGSNGSGGSGPSTRGSLNLRTLLDEGRIILSSEDIPERRAYVVVNAADGDAADFSASMVYVKLDAGTEILPGSMSGLEKSSVMVRTGEDSGLYGPFRMVTDGRGLTYVQPAAGSRPGIFGLLSRTDPCGLQGTNLYGLPVRLLVAFTSPKFFEAMEEDRMSDEELLAAFAKDIEGKSSSSWDIARWLEDHSGGLATFATDSAYFNEERAMRLSRILVSDFAAGSLRDTAAKLAVTLLTGEGVPPQHFDAVIDAAASSPRALKRLEASRKVQEEIEAARKELAGISLELSEARVKASESEAKSRLSAIEEEVKCRRADIGLIDESVTVAAHLEALRSEEAELSAARDRVAGELAELTARREEADRDIADFEGRLKTTVRRVADVAFDGAITAKILDAAQGWKEGEEKQARSRRVSYISKLPRLDLSGAGLVEELCGRFREERNWQRNDVINLFTCLAQGFLTIISGPPGSGKTSCCTILANTLGLTGLAARAAGTGLWPQADLAGRFIPVSVERGWTSKRDLIGYYNPITRTFEAADPHRCECFRELDAEARTGFAGMPYVMLLDEANLSPMEYYFADFMNICDVRGPASAISMGDGSRCLVPDTLRFLATINNDHTTEDLSPRLVDRAFIISLDGEKELTAAGGARNIEGRLPADWQKFLEAFGAGAWRLPRETAELLNGLTASVKKVGISASPRTRLACAGFAAVAAHWFEGTESASAGVLAADYACEQKMLPQASGSGAAYRTALAGLASELEARGLLRSAARVQKMLERGAAQMDYYRFFQ